MICELLFPSSILSVKLNRKTLVIVLETEIYIYDISNMRLLHVIETTPNPEGIPPSTHQSTCLTPYSRLCPICFRRQLLPRLSLSNSLSNLGTRRPIHFNNTSTTPTTCTPAAIRGRLAILHPLPYSRQRHSGPQIPPLLPRHQLHRLPSCLLLR